jgi:mono/diheme cytochrome c family protein
MKFIVPNLLCALIILASTNAQAGDAKRGEYVFHTGGCKTCHTSENGGALLAGGRLLKTDFGSFFTPNITPDPETGIGGWSDEDFVRALRRGVSPDGDNYYPTFPYTSYARMTRKDAVDLKAYLDSLPAVRNVVPEHDLPFPWSIRTSMIGWNLMFFDNEPFEPDPQKSKAWNRGAYLVNGPGHCGECHTPRNFLGVVNTGHFLGGNKNGPEGDAVPNITPGKGGIGDWSKDDILNALETGFLPDGDFMGGAMMNVIEDNTSKLTADDLQAIVAYLTSLEPIDSNN